MLGQSAAGPHLPGPVGQQLAIANNNNDVMDEELKKAIAASIAVQKDEEQGIVGDFICENIVPLETYL